MFGLAVMNRLKEIGEEPTEQFRYFSYEFFVEMTSFLPLRRLKFIGKVHVLHYIFHITRKSILFPF